MTQEDKELLFIDLCNRIHYKTICTSRQFDKSILVGMDDDGATFSYVDCLGQTIYELLDIIEFDVKPYLRPMSSMTDEEFEKLREYSGLKYEQLDLASYQSGTYKCLDFYLSEVPSYFVILVFDWLNIHHFDYRGLIERGLAIAVTEENNPYKE